MPFSRIALIHATPLAIDPIGAAFAADWPDVMTVNILEDSLSADLARDGQLTPAMTDRFVRLASYAVDTGADAILFTCSAFGFAIEEARDAVAPVPVLKPNEAMFEEVSRIDGEIGLVATFPPSVPSMATEFYAAVPGRVLHTDVAVGAMDALAAGDVARHDAMVVSACADLSLCDVIMLAQFSMAHAAPQVAKATAKTVLTSPGSAVAKLKKLSDDESADTA